VVLEPYRLAICGDFVRAAACPVEAAALSGLEAGDRVAAVLLGGAN
jgi:predicted NAD/FAD-dependent oxidoreductase